MNTEVVVALVTTAVPAVLGGTGWLVKHLLTVTRVLGEVKEQVANSHNTNLRDDIDEVVTLVRHVANTQGDHTQLLKLHSDVLTNLRTDLSWERRERMDLARVVTGREPIA